MHGQRWSRLGDVCGGNQKIASVSATERRCGDVAEEGDARRTRSARVDLCRWLCRSGKHGRSCCSRQRRLSRSLGPERRRGGECGSRARRDGEMHYEEASTCTFPTTLATTENNTVKSHGRRQRKANESYDDWEHTMRRKMSPMRERRFQSARRARRSARSCRWRLTTSCGAWFSGGQLIASIADIPLAFERGGTRRGGERAYGHIAEEVAYLLGGHRRRLGVLLCLARKRLHEDRETSAQTVKVRVLRLDDLLHDVRALLGLRVHWVT